jgi:3-methyladenine DNA glycosylase AlkD
MTAKSALTELKRLSSKTYLNGMARYGLPTDRAMGVPVGAIQKLGKRIGKDQKLAVALWNSGWYEARMLTAYIADPAALTPAQMDRWCRDFDSWGVCDTVCFVLFDRTPHVWRCVDRWSRGRPEFVRRAAFALMASLAVHDKVSADALFAERLPLVEEAASDERDLVRKGASWALRTTGRRNEALHGAALAVAKRLAVATDAGSRWVGKDAVRELTGPIVARQLQKRAAKKR